MELVGNHDGEARDFIIEELPWPASEVITTTASTGTRASTSTSGASTPAIAPSPAPEYNSRSTTPGQSAHQGATTPLFVSPPGAGASEGLDADHDDDAPLRYRDLDNVLG